MSDCTNWAMPSTRLDSTSLMASSSVRTGSKTPMRSELARYSTMGTMPSGFGESETTRPPLRTMALVAV